MGARPVTFTPDMVAAVGRLRGEGRNVDEISDLVGVCPQTLRAWRRSSGYVLAPIALSPWNFGVVDGEARIHSTRDARLLEAVTKASWSKVAYEFKVSKSVIAGVVYRERQKQKKARHGVNRAG
jgi:hypothetical protein